MAVINENDNETSQQEITLSNTTYILENGSISVSNGGLSLFVNVALSNVSIYLWGGLIENSNTVGILASSSVRVELSDNAAIRTASTAIRTDTAGAGVDIVNHGSIISGSTTLSTISATLGSGRLVNFGLIRGGATSGTNAVVALGTSSIVENAGIIEATSVTRNALSISDGTGRFNNSGLIFGIVTLGSGADIMTNSGTIQGTVLLGDGADQLHNSGTIIGGIDLGAGADQYRAHGGGGYSFNVNGGAGNDNMVGTVEDDNFNGDGDNDFLFGFGGDDVLSGDDGNDHLDGGAGNDVLAGVNGDDELTGGSGMDFVNGGDGIDTASYAGSLRGVRVSLVDSSVNTGDAAGDTIIDVENLAGSLFNDRLTGNAGANDIDGGNGNDLIEGGAGVDALHGGLGNDTLDGGTGGDAMDGGGGNDVYLVDSAADQIIEINGEGIDTVFAATVYTLGAGDEVEFLRASGSPGRLLNGNEFAQQIFGGTGADRLSGFGGNDILTGGLGRDFMTGGANDDVFKFLAKTHSVVGLNADRIIDFDDLGNDAIDISLLFGPKMVYRHSGVFTKIGQVRINDVAGADVIVEVNTVGTLAADFSIRLTATTLASMTASDFVL